MKLTKEQLNKIQELVKIYEEKYLSTEQGKKHLQSYNKEKEEVKKIFKEIKEKYEKGNDITEDVLYKLLPYSNTKYVREKGYRVSIWAAITKDIKIWFEHAGWQKRENWPNVAKNIFKLIDGLIKDKDKRHIDEFLKSEYSKGFQTGMISPILYCLNPEFLVINSKTVDTVNYILDREMIDNKLENYFKNIEIINDLLKKLNIQIFKESYDKFDAFCYWMCSIGRYARPKDREISVLEEEEIRVSSHSDAMGVLLELGNMLGYKTYVAHPSKKYKDKELKEIATLKTIPEKFKGIKGIEKVDVIWYAEEKLPHYFFEVEDKGDMKNALHKMYQARDLEAKFFIISPVERYSDFEKNINTEPYKNIRNKYIFKSYEDLQKFFSDVKLYYNSRKKFFEEGE